MTNEEKSLEALANVQTQDDSSGQIEYDPSAIKHTLERIVKKLDLLAEGHQTLLETLAPKSRVEQLEEDVSLLKSVIKVLAEKVDSLST